MKKLIILLELSDRKVMLFLCWSDGPIERFPNSFESIAMKLANILPSVFVDFYLVGVRFNEGYGSTERYNEIVVDTSAQQFSDIIAKGKLYETEISNDVFLWLYEDLAYYENEIVAIYNEGKMSLDHFFDLVDFPEFCIFGGPGGMYPSKTDWLAAFVRAGLATEPVLTYLSFMETRVEGFTNVKSSDNYVEDYFKLKDGTVTQLIIRGAIQFYFETFGVNNLQFKDHMKML